MHYNIEMVERLKKYFLKSDPRIVAEVLAHALIDLDSFNHIHLLPNEEKEDLLKRTARNSVQLIEFSEEGAIKPLAMRSVE